MKFGLVMVFITIGCGLLYDLIMDSIRFTIVHLFTGFAGCLVYRNYRNSYQIFAYLVAAARAPDMKELPGNSRAFHLRQ